jgi:virginiamycin A acetyltransferase
MSASRDAVKALGLAVATVLVSPLLLTFAVRARLLGRDRALEGASQLLSLVPGLVGQYLRRGFLRHVLEECHPSVTIEFGVLFSRAGARLEANVYVGPRTHLGLVHLERDVLIGAGVHVPSGPETHGTADPARPIRDQPGILRRVRIGAGSWIGSGAIVMADVGAGAVVGAGSVVTSPVPERVVAAGVPARVVSRRAASPSAEPVG